MRGPRQVIVAAIQKIINGRITENNSRRPTKALVYGIENKTLSMAVLILLIGMANHEHLSTTSIIQKTLSRFNNSKIADWLKSIDNKIMLLPNSTRGSSLEMSKTII